MQQKAYKYMCVYHCLKIRFYGYIIYLCVQHMYVDTCVCVWHLGSSKHSLHWPTTYRNCQNTMQHLCNHVLTLCQHTAKGCNMHATSLGSHEEILSSRQNAFGTSKWKLLKPRDCSPRLWRLLQGPTGRTT